MTQEKAKSIDKEGVSTSDSIVLFTYTIFYFFGIASIVVSAMLSPEVIPVEYTGYIAVFFGIGMTYFHMNTLDELVRGIKSAF